MVRIGGRQKGAGNATAMERIKENQSKFEKMLLDKALGGDVEAIAACLRLLADEEARKRAERKPRKAGPVEAVA